MSSVFLLGFVSIEHLLAGRRPHTFSLSSLRAKRPLVVIAVIDVEGGTNQTLHTSASCFSGGDHCRKRRGHGGLLHAMTMSMKVSTVRRNVASRSTHIPGPTTVNAVTSVVPKDEATSDVSKNKSVSVIKKTTANQAITYICAMV